MHLGSPSCALIRQGDFLLYVAPPRDLSTP
jgi:hypothetical protein